MFCPRGQRQQWRAWICVLPIGSGSSRRAPARTTIPGAYKASQLAAEHIGGYPGSTWTDAFNIPVTAHFIGGCVIGADAERGVIDPYHRVYNYPGLSIVDGSTISANLGVNPSLTITAQAERAMAMWPNKDQPDTRPPQEQGYIPVAPVLPENPAVPQHAPAALRLPERDGTGRRLTHSCPLHRALAGERN